MLAAALDSRRSPSMAVEPAVEALALQVEVGRGEGRDCGRMGVTKPCKVQGSLSNGRCDIIHRVTITAIVTKYC